MTDPRIGPIAEGLQDPIIAVSGHNTIVYMNKAFSSFLPDAKIGDPVGLWIAPIGDHIADMLSMARSSSLAIPFRARTTRDSEREFRGRHWRLADETGEPLVVLQLLDPADGSSRFALLNETIKKLNQEIRVRRSIEQALRETVRDLEIANQTKDHFLAEVSHDFRTPLNAIIGFSEAMQSNIGGTLDDRHRDYVDHIQVSAKMLLDLVNHLLQISDGEIASDELRETLLSLNDCLAQCISTVRSAHASKEIEFLIPADHQLPALVASKRSVMSALTNLLDNAAKFSPRNGRVEIRVNRLANDGLALSITDRGPGIPRQEIPNLTMPLYRTQPVHQTRPEGHGLGLTITADHLKAIESTFEIESAEGGGTTVTVRFPHSRVCWPRQDQPARY